MAERETERETERTVKKRAESDPAYQWHIQDLYASDEVWEKDYEALSEQAKELAAYEGIMKIRGIVFTRGLQERRRHYLYSLTVQLYLKSRNF